jgi:hypothetical protein
MLTFVLLCTSDFILNVLDLFQDTHVGEKFSEVECELFERCMEKILVVQALILAVTNNRHSD